MGLCLGLNTSAITPSQCLFKMEVKVDIKPHQGEIDAINLNHWFQQLKVYFNVHHMEKEKNISCA
jgi:hypothetical protein